MPFPAGAAGLAFLLGVWVRASALLDQTGAVWAASRGVGHGKAVAP